MAFDFPSNPAPGQVFSANGVGYTWSGYAWLMGVTSGASIADVPPESPSPGQLWWESDTGALYVYYSDGNSHAWVQTNGTDKGDDLGAGTGGVAVTVSDTPPASPSPGQLWWESDTGTFALSYDDGNSQQWVQIGAGPPGPPGPPGPAGGSGAVVDFVQKFGGVGDGSTDNAPMLMAFHTYAKAESDAGRAVEMYVPPGVYNFNHKNCQGFLWNIRKLRIVGYGAIWQNTYNQSISGFDFNAELVWGRASQGDTRTGYLVGQTAVGATTLTLTTPADHTNFAVGDWILLASLDVQFYGEPPNPNRFEFVKITAKNAGTGVLTVNPPVKQIHRTDFPDTVTGYPLGKARIFQINRDIFTGVPLLWNIDHSYEGMEFRLPPTTTITYMTATGRRIRYKDCTLPGISQTLAMQIEMIGGRLTDISEPDKMVNLCIYENMDYIHNLVNQSSIDRVIIRGCTIGTLGSGSAKIVSVTDCDIGVYEERPSFGMNRHTSINNSIVRAMPYPIMPGGNIITVDGTNTIYANGVFSFLMTTMYTFNAQAVPGAAINIQCANQFSGPAGTGIVLSVTESGGYMRVATTLPYASMPTWASGNIALARLGTFDAKGSHGCDNIVRAAQASERNKQPWEFHRDVIGGKSAANGYWGWRYGALTRLRANVLQPCTSPGARLELTKYNLQKKSDMSDPQAWQAVFDVTVAGLREYDLVTLVGKTANDTMVLGGVAQTALPANRWFDGTNVFWSYAGFAPADHTSAECPLIVIEMEFDCGIFRESLSPMADVAGNVLIPVQGGF